MSTTSGQQFSMKDPARAVVLTLDCTNELPAGVTLTGTPTVSVSVNSGGPDPTPQAILNGSPQVDASGMKIVIPVAGGVLDTTYDLLVQCNTTSPYLSMAESVLLPVGRDWTP